MKDPIKDARSYYQGKIDALKEALTLSESSFRSVVEARVKEYQEVLASLNPE